MKLNWDEALPQALIDEWKQITSDWKKLCGLHIPRYIGVPEEEVSYQLIVMPQ